MSLRRQYFGTDGIRGRVGEYPINAEFFLKLGWAVGCVLARQGDGKVLIGKDTRISGYMFESALEAGLSAAGIDSCLLGPMPTPAVAYLTRTLGAQAGIVISASHNLFLDNGLKFFSAHGSKLPDDLESAIEAQLQKPMTTVNSSALGKAVRIVDAPGRYVEFCKSTVNNPYLSLTGLKLVVDCANGAAYRVAPAVFRELGATVVEIATKPNGLNINDHCGATYLKLLKQTVLAERADLGIALDGDADRLIMVDHLGQPVDGDELLFIIAKHRFNKGKLSRGIVGTHMSNLGLEQAIHRLGLDFYRAKIGDRYVLQALSERQWTLGGEASGHLVCLDLTTTGDGIIAALQVLSALRDQETSLYDLKRGMQKYPQTLVNIAANVNKELIHYGKIQTAIQEAEHQLSARGRVLLRQSGTEPVVRVMVEGEDALEVATLAHALAKIVEAEIA